MFTAEHAERYKELLSRLTKIQSTLDEIHTSTLSLWDEFSRDEKGVGEITPKDGTIGDQAAIQTLALVACSLKMTGNSLDSTIENLTHTGMWLTTTLRNLIPEEERNDGNPYYKVLRELNRHLYVSEMGFDPDEIAERMQKLTEQDLGTLADAEPDTVVVEGSENN